MASASNDQRPQEEEEEVRVRQSLKRRVLLASAPKTHVVSVDREPLH